VAACGLAPASATPDYPAAAGALSVVAAENFYGDLLHQLGGTNLRVFSFLKDPNVDPHEYESSAADARAVADASLVVENGDGYDTFLDKLLSASPNSSRVVINVQHLVGAADGSNPHLWYDPAVMPRVAQAAADALVRLDGNHASLYRQNLSATLASLGDIEAKVMQLRPTLNGQPVAFTEPVFGYMSDALGLQVLSPEAFMKAVEEGNDPPSQAVAAEQDLLTGHRVKVLIYNSQAVTPLTTSIRQLALTNGVPVVGVSETEPAGQDYQHWQLAQLAAVAAAIGG